MYLYCFKIDTVTLYKQPIKVTRSFTRDEVCGTLRQPVVN